MNEENKPKSATIYDFANPGHKLDASWPILDVINEQTAVEFGALLAYKLQVALQCQRLSTKSTRYSDCLAELGSTCMVFELSLEPLKDTVWFCMDTSVIATIVDAYFGGDAVLIPVEEPRDLTRTEQRVVNHVIDALMRSLSTAWSTVMPINVKSIGSIDIGRLKNSSSDKVMVVGDLLLLLGSTELPCQIIYPYESLEPYEAKLRQEEVVPIAPIDQQFHSDMQGRLMHCEIDIRGVLSEMPITLGKLLELKSGDFIPLRDVQTVSFKTQNIPLFDARVGNSNGRVSASVSRWHLPVQN
ncbi:MAG: flagellar motor switch protein FliM [Pseudomonadales bacterium]|jgi:flagellar motor switch protein FliM